MRELVCPLGPKGFFVSRRSICQIFAFLLMVKIIEWVSAWQNQQIGICDQRRLRSAWASAQSDLSLRCPYKENFGPKLPFERIAKTLIRLGGCSGWSESSLGAHAIFLALSCAGSNAICIGISHSLSVQLSYSEEVLCDTFFPCNSNKDETTRLRSRTRSGKRSTLKLVSNSS